LAFCEREPAAKSEAIERRGDPFLLSALMQLFSRIVESFSEADAWYDQRINALKRAGSGAERVEARQQVHARAYYLLLWAQFESGVNDRCRRAIVRGKQRSKWRDKRAWYIYNETQIGEGDRELSFLDRVALLVDKGSHTYRDIKEKYELRNNLAHGRWPNTPIDLHAEAKDFAHLVRRLRV
jgi:hypothetical protein